MAADSALMNTFSRLPVSFAHGEGVWLYDENGKRYLDAISGIGVNALGHAHPALVQAICEQAGRLIHTSNLYGIRHQSALAEQLCALGGMDRAFFCNSGAEANEAAIKLARLYGHRRDVAEPAVLVMTGAFHGRTLATISASAGAKLQAGFEPLVSGFLRVPFGDNEAVRAAARDNPNIVAVLVEPVQGEGGVNLLPDATLRELRQLCDEHEWLLMLDEVQSGNGRTGRYFACQHADVQPDVITTAKGLGGGMPIGACLARGAAAEVFGPGSHGTTFGGNPLACAAALAVVGEIDSAGLAANAETQGAYLLSQLRERLAQHPAVKDIRGRGLMLGIEFDRPCAELVAKALDQGLLINVTAANVVRLLPPLIISRDESDRLLDGLCPLLLDFGQDG